MNNKKERDKGKDSVVLVVCVKAIKPLLSQPSDYDSFFFCIFWPTSDYDLTVADESESHIGRGRLSRTVQELISLINC